MPPPLPEHVIEIRDAEALTHVLTAAQGRPHALISIPGAARLLGAPWWHALTHNHPAPTILDCDTAAGRAITALTLGQTHLVFDPASPQYPAIAALAEQHNATVLPTRPDCFVMGLPPYTPYRLTQLQRYFSTPNPSQDQP